MTSVHIQLPYGLDSRKTRKDFAEGLCPDAVAYGFHHAEDFYSQITYSEDRPEDLVGSFIRRAVFKLMGFDLVHAWCNRRSLDRADMVWTMLETDFLGVRFVQWIRPWVKRTPVLAQSVWMFDPRYKPIWPLSLLHRILTRGVSLLMTHSNAYLPIMRDRFPGVESRLSYFGVSTDSFYKLDTSPQESSGPLVVFAAGNDRTRDWDTLLRAFGNDVRFRIILVCGWASDELTLSYANLELVRDPTMEGFRDLYSLADVVVVPMHDNLYSGITVALEAAATGRPLLSTRAGAVPTYFGEDEALFTPVGDPEAMRDRLLSTTIAGRQEMASRARERFVRDDYTTRGMVKRYVALTSEVLRTAS